MANTRTTALKGLAEAIAQVSLGHPVRLAVDGRTASGKTTLSNEVAAMLRASGRAIIRTSIDGFHRPKAQRYARGRYSSDGYYYDARDLAAVRTMLLDPLGSQGNRLYRTASFDLDRDRPIEQEPQKAPDDAILIVDGTFLQRPELETGWDLTIFVATSETESEARGTHRDADRLGGASAARDLYAQRYRPAFALYERLCSPATRADAIVNNEVLDAPSIHIRRGGRLARSIF